MSLSFKIAALVAVLGWGFAGYQTICYLGVRVQIEATKAQVATDANKAAEAAVEALQASHNEEIKSLLTQLDQNQQAAAAARAEKSRLLAKLGRFEHELEALRHEPETAAYLAVPVPGVIRDHGLRAQHGYQTEGGENH